MDANGSSRRFGIGILSKTLLARLSLGFMALAEPNPKFYTHDVLSHHNSIEDSLKGARINSFWSLPRASF